MTSTSSLSSFQKRPEKELVLNQIIENARDGSQYPKHFPIGKHMGIEFSVSVTFSPQDKLSFFLHAENKAQESKNRAWSFPCRYLLHESSLKKENSSEASNSCDKFHIGDTRATENAVKFEIRVWVPECLKTFDDPRYSDASILVDGEEFLISKLFLSSQCTFFDSAFKWAAEQGKEPKITDDTFYAHEVQHFLELIHGEIITKDDDIEALLEMSRYFDSSTGIRRCAQFMMNDTKTSLAFKFEMGLKFDVSEMKKLCIQSVKTVQELQQLLPQDISKLDKNDLVDCLEKSLEFQSLKVLPNPMALFPTPVGMMGRPHF